MTTRESSTAGIERRGLAATAGILTLIVGIHTFSALLGPIFGAVDPRSAWPATGAAVLLGFALAAGRQRRLRLSLVAGGALLFAVAGTVTAGLALGLAGGAALWLSDRLHGWLPAELDGALGARRWVRVVWAASLLMAIVQIGRLATHMVNPDSGWMLTTANPFWADHECLSAYFHGAELGLRGEANVYDAAHYPGLNPGAAPQTHLDGMTVEDPFQYAPQFLLWPWLGMVLTSDYATLRIVWFALQLGLFAGVTGLLGRFVSGRAGRVALLLAPLALSAFPALHALQYGQFHLAAIGLALAGMLAVERRQEALGGALLAVATLSKIFPGLLLVLLLAQRRFKALAWTAGFGLVLTAGTLMIFGTAPFEAFVTYHLPRLQSGQAFAFGEAWPEIRELVIADNQGVFGLVGKLSEMGVVGMTAEVAGWANRIFLVVLVGGTLSLGPTLATGRSEDRAAAWLALLGLASLASTGAFGDYVPLTATWLLTLVAWRLRDQPEHTLWVVPAWLFQFFLIGTAPILEWAPPAVMMPLSAVGFVLLFATFVWGLRPGRARERIAADDRRLVVEASAV